MCFFTLTSIFVPLDARLCVGFSLVFFVFFFLFIYFFILFFSYHKVPRVFWVLEFIRLLRCVILRMYSAGCYLGFLFLYILLRFFLFVFYSNADGIFDLMAIKFHCLYKKKMKKNPRTYASRIFYSNYLLNNYLIAEGREGIKSSQVESSINLI